MFRRVAVSYESNDIRLSPLIQIESSFITFKTGTGLIYWVVKHEQLVLLRYKSSTLWSLPQNLLAVCLDSLGQTNLLNVHDWFCTVQLWVNVMNVEFVFKIFLCNTTLTYGALHQRGRWDDLQCFPTAGLHYCSGFVPCCIE